MLGNYRRLLNSLLLPPRSHSYLAVKRSQAYRISSPITFLTRNNFRMASTHQSSTRFTVQVKGPGETGYDDHRDLLLVQLEKIPRDIQSLEITEDTPSSIEWELLGNHFNKIKDLEMCSGFNEQLNDAELPEHWPLERLHVSDACGEVFRSPFVLEGRVKHLVLLGTFNLRFDGPTSDELYRAHNEAIERGEKEAEYVGKIQMVYLPELVTEMMNERYAGTRSALASISRNDDQPLLPSEVSTKMTKLEIIENDSLDTFSRMTIALPHIAKKLSTVNLRSTLGNDFQLTGEDLFTCLLPQLTEMKTLVLTVGEVFKDESLLQKLYSILPPNLSTLRFRGPTSLVKSGEWDNWKKSFASPEFLPKLERLSFALDLHYDAAKENPAYGRRPTRAPDDVLRDAQDECQQLYRAVEQRGVVVEPFQDKWVDRWSLLEQVDERWMRL